MVLEAAAVHSYREDRGIQPVEDTGGVCNSVSVSYHIQAYSGAVVGEQFCLNC